MPNIIIENGAWGSSRLQDIHAVVQSVCDIFLTDAAIDVADSIIVCCSECEEDPITLVKRGPNNEHIILVTTNDCLWSQLAYQFAHEYCHVFSAHYRVPGITVPKRENRTLRLKAFQDEHFSYKSVTGN